MKPRISLITLGVGDLERSVRFYRDGLGLATEGIVGKQFEDGAVIRHGRGYSAPGRSNAVLRRAMRNNASNSDACCASL